MISFKAKLFNLLLSLKKLLSRPLKIYPFCLRSEKSAVSRVLSSGDWNSCYSAVNSVSKAELALSRYLKVKEAVLVTSGGTAIEMVLRILANSDSSIYHHNNTCAAVPFSILRSGHSPYFFGHPDFINPPPPDLSSNNILLHTNFWGCVDDSFSSSQCINIEDSCLSFGSTYADDSFIHSSSAAAIFSFGCIKPLQSGEGGLVATNDSELAKELRIMREYANETRITGNSSITKFGLNGRISNITAAIIEQQIEGYTSYLSLLKRSVYQFARSLSSNGLNFFIYNIEHSPLESQSLTSIILYQPNCNAYDLSHKLRENGINSFPSFFNPLSSEPYFKNGLYNKDFPYLPLNPMRDSITAYHHINCFSPYVSIPRFWFTNIIFRKYLFRVLIRLSNQL